MKKSIQLAACMTALAIVAGSCKKESLIDSLLPKSEYYFKCKVDGILKEFKIPDSAFVNSQIVPPFYSFAAGAVDNLSSMTHLSVNINDYSGQKIKTGFTYKTVVTGGIPQIQAFLVWSNLMGESYNSPLSMLGPIKESAEIVLDEITDKYVKGRFKGKLLPDDVNSAVVKYNITDGEFYLPIRKAATTTTGGTGEGFLVCDYDATTINIKEKDDVLNAVFGGNRILTDGGGNKSYAVSVSAQSNTLSPKYQYFQFMLIDYQPFEAKTYQMPATLGQGPIFSSSYQYKQSGYLKTYVSAVNDFSLTSATVTFTKLGKIKGEYIEGSFSIQNYTNVTSNPIHVTNGKFKVMIK